MMMMGFVVWKDGDICDEVCAHVRLGGYVESGLP